MADYLEIYKKFKEVKEIEDYINDVIALRYYYSTNQFEQMWKHIDLSMYEGCDESDNYYRGYNREAIGMGGWCGTAEVMAHRIADGFRNSANHWRYVGSSEYCYIAVGVVHENNNWYVCVCMSHTNYGD